MRFGVLGPLCVEADGRTAAPSGAKERAVLARLLLEPGRPVLTEALLEAVWPGVAPDAAARSLQVRLARPRAFLEPGRGDGAPSTVLVRDGPAGYRLAVAPEHVDAVRFSGLVREAAGLPPPGALAAYDAALTLWRGPAFADVRSAEFAQPEIRRLEALHLRAREARAEALVATGRHDEALAELAELLAAEPLREALGRTLALALYRAGRQLEALDTLRAQATALRDLGLEPGAESGALERQILRRDGALAPDACPPAPVSHAPPAAAAARSRAARPSAFFGRGAHLERAGELLDGHPLVTITGVGGAGKTRLAIELAARRDGPAWLCELAPTGADADVGPAVAAALGLPDAGADAARVVDHLARSSGLLLLDNCEHVLEGAAALAERVVLACPEVRVLATSRTPLGVDGERLLRLTGLEVPAGGGPQAAQSPAVALFLDRARAAGGLVDDAGALDAVAEICRRVDGLPLAIELAAGRTRSLAPAEIAARLDARLGLLAVSGRRAAERHATLRAAIGWSYDLLDAPARRLFERLSVFARGCTLPVAEAVCAGDAVAARDVALLLDGLVAHSLVTATALGGRTSFGLLETLREYAGERLAERGERDRWHDAHVDYYVAESERLVRGGWRSERLPFVDEFEELRAALRWCLEHDAAPDRAFVLAEALWWPVPSRHGDEAARLAEQALARWPAPHPRRPGVLGTASVARLVCGDAPTAERHARAAVALEDVAAGPALLARRTLAQLAFFGDDLRAAAAAWDDVAARARAAGVPAAACEADGFRVQLLQATGDAGGARLLAAALREESANLRSPLMVNWARYVSGVIELDDDPEAARGWLGQALASARESDHHHMVRFSLRALGVAATLAGRHDEAAARLFEALEHDEARSDHAQQRTTLRAAAVLAAAAHRTEAAAELLAATDGWPAAPYLVRLATATQEQVTTALGPQRAAAAAARGRALDLPAAKALARDAVGQR